MTRFYKSVAQLSGIPSLLVSAYALDRWRLAGAANTAYNLDASASAWASSVSCIAFVTILLVFAWFGILRTKPMLWIPAFYVAVGAFFSFFRPIVFMEFSQHRERYIYGHIPLPFYSYILSSGVITGFAFGSI